MLTITLTKAYNITAKAYGSFYIYTNVWRFHSNIKHFFNVFQKNVKA